MKVEITKEYLSKLQYEIIGAAIEVHRRLGPGLLESVYHKCMIYELRLRGLKVLSEVRTEIKYKEMDEGDEAIRCDLFVEDLIVVELKAVEYLNAIFETKTLTYMRLLEVPKGLLINFNCTNISEHGYKSFVNEFYRLLPD